MEVFPEREAQKSIEREDDIMNWRFVCDRGGRRRKGFVKERSDVPEDEV